MGAELIFAHVGNFPRLFWRNFSVGASRALWCPLEIYELPRKDFCFNFLQNNSVLNAWILNVSDVVGVILNILSIDDEKNQKACYSQYKWILFELLCYIHGK